MKPHLLSCFNYIVYVRVPGLITLKIGAKNQAIFSSFANPYDNLDGKFKFVFVKLLLLVYDWLNIVYTMDNHC